MKTIITNCPECRLEIEYWTRNDFIECPNCHNKIVNLSGGNIEEETIIEPEFEEVLE